MSQNVEDHKTKAESPTERFAVRSTDPVKFFLRQEEGKLIPSNVVALCVLRRACMPHDRHASRE